MTRYFAKAVPAVLSATMALSLLSAPVAVPAWGASEGSPTIEPKCRRGKVWDRVKKKCVPAAEESNLSNDSIYAAARNLAYDREYAEAIRVLRLAPDGGDPRILNYLGYSHRKLGRVEEGLTYYRAALKADPDYTLVREYMGEAFLQLGQVDKAREQLAEIERRCGRDCREYDLLESQIAAYRN